MTLEDGLTVKFSGTPKWAIISVATLGGDLAYADRVNNTPAPSIKTDPMPRKKPATRTAKDRESVMHTFSFQLSRNFPSLPDNPAPKAVAVKFEASSKSFSPTGSSTAVAI